jgi:Sulfotransferase family
VWYHAASKSPPLPGEDEGQGQREVPGERGVRERETQVTVEGTTNVFVGGWRNTGTRLVCRLLQQRGFDCLEALANPTLDYRGIEFRSLFKALMLFGDYSLIDKIKQDTERLAKWVVKHGHLMLIIPLLKEHFPRSRFICCVRNPLDMIHKGRDRNYVEFGLSRNSSPPTLEKLETIKRWYDAALPHVDLLLRLEELVFDRVGTIHRLYSYLGCDCEVNADVLKVVGAPSSTIGAGRGRFGPGETKAIEEYAARLGY